MYALLYVIVSYYSKIDKKFTLFIEKGFLFSGFLFILLGLFQYFFFPDLRWLVYFGWDDHYYRLVGTLLDPSYTGLLLVLLIIYLLKEVRDRGKFYYLYLLLAFISLLLTYSRSSYLSFLAVVPLLFWNRKRIFIFFLTSFLIFLLFFASVLLLPQPNGEGVNLTRTSTIYSRLKSQRQAWSIFKKNYLIGVGFNNYRVASRHYGFLDNENWKKNHAAAGVENSFLFVLATTGILGGLMFLKFIIDYAKRRNNLIFILPIALHSMFNNSFFYPWIMLFWWLLL
jgi:O-antigen ligase